MRRAAGAAAAATAAATSSETGAPPLAQPMAEDDHVSAAASPRHMPNASRAAGAAPTPAPPWNAVAEMVRKLVVERKAPEQGANLRVALDEISISIFKEGREAAGSGEGSGAARDGLPSSAPPTTPSSSPLSSDAPPASDHGAPPHELVDHPASSRPISAGVLCFDEVQMMDIADASIVSGVLSRLFDAGWVLVATCNRTPHEFAESMMHREHPQVTSSAYTVERLWMKTHRERPTEHTHELPTSWSTSQHTSCTHARNTLSQSSLPSSCPPLCSGSLHRSGP